MALKNLERILKDLGYSIVRNSKHKIWSNGIKSVAVPHQREINRILSKHILKEIGYNS